MLWHIYKYIVYDDYLLYLFLVIIDSQNIIYFLKIYYYTLCKMVTKVLTFMILMYTVSILHQSQSAEDILCTSNYFLLKSLSFINLY